jgi:hypothetical protein
MNHNLSWLCTIYTWLLQLYPRRYRALFADEMQAVFAQALVEATAQGGSAVWTLCGRELRDLPRLLCTEYWLLCQQWLQARLCNAEPTRTDLPGVVPVGYGSVPHVLFVVAGRNPRMRRLFDLVIALFGLGIAAPLFLVLPLLIKLDSPGPVLYRQQRVGKQGRPYTMYKFRSMQVGTSLPAQTHTHQTPYDARLTRVGRWARRYCLDEMPQLFNVLKGDMSIFGPRPRLPGQS